ncbi:Protein MEI2-like 4, partial [Mucuna pruriens]
MPSETIDFKSFSSSLYSSEDICSSNEVPSRFFLNIYSILNMVLFLGAFVKSSPLIHVFSFSWQRQASLWNSDSLPKCYALDLTIMASFCGVVLSRLLSIGIRTFHHVSQLQTNGTPDIVVLVLSQPAWAAKCGGILGSNCKKATHRDALMHYCVGTNGKFNQSLTFVCHVDFDQGIKTSLNVQALSHLSDSSKVNIVATQHESSLFSMRLSANNDLYGHSVDTVASHYEEERLFDSLEELEAQIIGNLLPSDDDLLSGVTNDHIIQDSTGNDMDELDLFSSVGGMDLGDDNSSSLGQKNSEILDGACNSQLGLYSTLIAGEPYNEHPSRTLVVRNINCDVEDSELKALFEYGQILYLDFKQFGDIETLDTTCKHRKFVVISYYDIRAAQNAMRTLQNRKFSCRKFDVHYSNPKDSPSKKDMNQGTLVAFLYDSSVSNNELHRIFNVYGEIKEIRENPDGRHHKLIEYYDVRAAEAALRALNRDDTTRKRLRVEPSQSEDSKQCMVQQIHPELEQKESSLYLHQNSPPLKSPTSFPGLHGVSKSGNMDDGGRIIGVEPTTGTPTPETAFVHGVSSSVPNSLPSSVSVKSVDNRCEITESGSPGQLNFDIQAASTFHPHSLPKCHDGLANSAHRVPPEVAANFNLKTQERIDNMQFCQVNSNGRFMEFNECAFKSTGNGSCPLPGHHYKWGNSYQPPGIMWPNSPSYFDGVCAASNLPRLHGLPSTPSHMITPVLPINSQHVPSSHFWDRRHTYAGESLGNMRFSGNTTAHCVDFVSYNIFPHFGGNCVDLRILPKNLGLHFHNQRDLMFPGRNHMVNSFETHKQRARSRRNEGVSNLADKKQYELDIDRIKSGEDNRTTLMIKNIPNKYTSKMLLAAIDERHRGTYDFVYLPIDFRFLCFVLQSKENTFLNKCNVGYAFINMTNPGLIIPFYQVFNGKKWEKFNSEKVASLAYARIQGKAALIAHFQNSSLMNEDKRCRPILFNSDGPNAGDQVPFPVGVNVRNRTGRVRNNAQEDNLQGSPPNLGNSKLSSDGDSSFN